VRRCAKSGKLKTLCSCDACTHALSPEGQRERSISDERWSDRLKDERRKEMEAMGLGSDKSSAASSPSPLAEGNDADEVIHQRDASNRAAAPSSAAQVSAAAPSSTVTEAASPRWKSPSVNTLLDASDGASEDDNDSDDDGEGFILGKGATKLLSGLLFNTGAGANGRGAGGMAGGGPASRTPIGHSAHQSSLGATQAAPTTPATSAATAVPNPSLKPLGSLRPLGGATGSLAGATPGGLSSARPLGLGPAAPLGSLGGSGSLGSSGGVGASLASLKGGSSLGGASGGRWR